MDLVTDTPGKRNHISQSV